MHDEAGSIVVRAIKGIISGIAGLNPPDIIDWIESTLEWPDGSAEDGPIILEPYQIAPIRNQMIPGTETGISMPEQNGKTTCWNCPSLYKARFDPAPAMIIYENRKKAEDINESIYEPIMMSIPYFKELKEDRPDLFVKGKYKFPGAWINIYGAGADLTSVPKRDLYDEEIDTQPLIPEKQISQCKNVRKRARSYSKLGLHNIVWCGSFKRNFKNSTMWWLAAQSDMSFWHLRCKGCKKLTINSTGYVVKLITGTVPRWVSIYQKTLKYKVDDSQKVIPSSCRLVCPECQHEHKADELLEMNSGLKGKYKEDQYISKYPKIKDFRFFIVGGLGGRAGNLAMLCESHLKLRQSRSQELKRDIMNSDFGLPLDPSVISGNARDKFDSHCVPRLKKKSDFFFTLMSCDTQTSPYGWYWVVRGYNDKGSFYITSGFCSVLREDRTVNKKKTEKEFKKLIRQKYTGHVPLFVIIDQGGGTVGTKAVKRMAREFHNVFQYKGEGNRSSKAVRFSKERGLRRLILATEKTISDDLRWHIYKDDRTTWFLPNEGINPIYQEQVLNVDPETGEMIEEAVRKDYYDCEKQFLALEYALEFRLAEYVTKIKEERAREKLKEKPKKEAEDNEKGKKIDEIKDKSVTVKQDKGPQGGGNFITNW